MFIVFPTLSLCGLVKVYVIALLSYSARPILILINDGSSDLRILTYFTTKINHFQNQI
jgi:hypothetical protein